MVTAVEAGITDGAVKSPPAVIVPAVAVHVTLVCPVAVNSCTVPSVTFTVAGETVMGGEELFTNVTVAVPAWLFDPAALMVTALDAGITAGAVKSPVELIVPAEAVHVTLDCPVAVNCFVVPRVTLADAGETVMAPPPSPVPDVNGTVSGFDASVPGFFTVTTTFWAGPWYPVPVNCVEETNAVGSWMSATVIRAPFRKPVPFTVMWYVPTWRGLGETEVNVGPSDSITTYAEPTVMPFDAVALIVTGF